MELGATWSNGRFPAHGRGLELVELQGAFQPKPFYVSAIRSLLALLPTNVNGFFPDQISNFVTFSCCIIPHSVLCLTCIIQGPIQFYLCVNQVTGHSLC